MSDMGLLYILLGISFLVIVGVPAHAYFVKKQRDIFHPIYVLCLTFLIQYWVRSLEMFIVGNPLMVSPPFEAELMRAWNLAWIYLIISYLLFLVGYYGKWPRVIAHRLPRIPLSWWPQRMPIAASALVLVGLTAFGLLVGRFGGVRSFLFNRSDVFTSFGVGYLLFLSTLPSIALIICFIGFREFNQGRLLLLAAAILTFAIGLSTTSRSSVLCPILSLAIAWRYLKVKQVANAPRASNWKFVLVVAVIILVIFPAALTLRSQPESGLSDITESLSRIYRDPASLYFCTIGSHYQSIIPFVYTVLDTPEVMEYQLGWTYLTSLVQWIPRQIYSEKPASFAMEFTDTYIGDFYFDNVTIISPTVLGEGYINFHIAGMFAVAIVSGIFWRFLYQYFVMENGRNLSGIMIFSLIYPYTLIFWENFSGGFFQLIGTLVIGLFMCVFLARGQFNGSGSRADIGQIR